MLILNSGGTFNKRYNEINGDLEVPFDNVAIESILESVDSSYSLAGVVYKDSLEIDTNDRVMLANIIKESTDDSFIIVHGTDTMSLSAEFFDEVFDDRLIILTGAMKPFEIDKVESSLNLGIALGFAQGSEKKGVYICMNGYVKVYNELIKNKQKGKFELVR